MLQRVVLIRSWSRLFRASKYSIISSVVGGDMGPLLMAASISGQLSLAVKVTIACMSPIRLTD